MEIRMYSYLKSLGLHVYLSTTKQPYIDNGKYFRVNAQSMVALKQTLSYVYLFKVVANCDSTFTV